MCYNINIEKGSEIMENLKSEAIKEIMYLNNCDEDEAENTLEDLMYFEEMEDELWFE